MPSLKHIIYFSLSTSSSTELSTWSCRLYNRFVRCIRFFSCAFFVGYLLFSRWCGSYHRTSSAWSARFSWLNICRAMSLWSIERNDRCSARSLTCSSNRCLHLLRSDTLPGQLLFGCCNTFCCFFLRGSLFLPPQRPRLHIVFVDCCFCWWVLLFCLAFCSFCSGRWELGFTRSLVCAGTIELKVEQSQCFIFSYAIIYCPRTSFDSKTNVDFTSVGTEVNPIVTQLLLQGGNRDSALAQRNLGQCARQVKCSCYSRRTKL